MKFEIEKADFENIVMGGLVTGHGPFAIHAGQRIKSVRTIPGNAKRGRIGAAIIELEDDPDYVEPETED